MYATVKGTFRLTPGTSLIPGERDGIVFSSAPLRAIRVSASAFALLQKTQAGLSFGQAGLAVTGPAGSTLQLFDRFCQAGLLEWRPPAARHEPLVSIVVAVYNRAAEIGPCIESLLALNYPAAKLEIIVVDDASEDGTRAVVSRYAVKLMAQEHNRGQSAARNAGVSEAEGELVAFTDSDCIADPDWLRKLVPYFQDSRNALVGGLVDSYYRESLLDRYDEAKSPLNMGARMLVGSGEESAFYVPTCNMLVRKDAYVQVGGLDEGLRVGEDVDFCWRLKEHGFRLVYVPQGTVRHKHRNRFTEAFSRRFDYGASEPLLYARHNAIAKRYPWLSSCMAVFLLCVSGLLSLQPLFLPAAALVLFGDAIGKKRFYGTQTGIPVAFTTVLKATAIRHFELLYHLTYHLVRYHLILMSVLAVLFPPLIPLIAAIILLPPVVEYGRKRPRLSFFVFFLFYLAEQAAYQAGVFRGCLKQRSFRTYRLVFVMPGNVRPTGMLEKLKAIFWKSGDSPGIVR